jgi:hypothetical protein
MESRNFNGTETFRQEESVGHYETHVFFARGEGTGGNRRLWAYNGDTTGMSIGGVVTYGSSFAGLTDVAPAGSAVGPVEPPGA